MDIWRFFSGHTGQSQWKIFNWTTQLKWLYCSPLADGRQKINHFLIWRRRYLCNKKLHFSHGNVKLPTAWPYLEKFKYFSNIFKVFGIILLKSLPLYYKSLWQYFKSLQYFKSIWLYLKSILQFKDIIKYLAKFYNLL